jgi:peptide/nickel transport system permease protein
VQGVEIEMNMEPNTPSQEWEAYEVKQHAPLWRRTMNNKMFFVGGTTLFALLLLAILIPLLSQTSPTKMNFSATFAPPSLKYLMGTDQYGRSTFIRTIYGIRTSFLVASISVLIGVVGGVIIGGLSGFFRGMIDGILMRIVDSVLAFPSLLLAIGLATSLGPGLKTVYISIGVIYIARFSRLMRGSVLVEQNKEYVEAARATGQFSINILIKHILPNCIPPIIVLATILFAGAMSLEAVMSFIGVGISPPTPSLGTMLNESRRYLASSAYMSVFPGIVISLAILGVNLLGDGLRDILDPKIYSNTK